MSECKGAGRGPRAGVRAIVVTLAGVATMAAGNSALAGPHYIRFDVAGAASTEGITVNNSDVIAGVWQDGSGHSHGFVRAPDGTISSFNPTKSGQTESAYINGAGIVAGTFKDVKLHEHGYIRTPGGTIINFDPVGSKLTGVAGINNSDVVSGFYWHGRHYHGFIRGPDGSFVSYDVPGARSTLGGAINDNGAIAGEYYKKNDNNPHAFIRNADGSFTTFDVPGATKTWGGVINANGVVAGVWTDSRTTDHSYIRAPNGVITPFDPPGTSQEPGYGSHAIAINSKGRVVGFYGDADTLAYRGFVRRKDGTFKTFAVSGQETFAVGINDQSDVTGSFGAGRGFLRTP